MAKEVKGLGKVRDEYLPTDELGRTFVSAYYRYSPPLADWVAKHPMMRKIVRIGLYPTLRLSLFSYPTFKSCNTSRDAASAEAE